MTSKNMPTLFSGLGAESLAVKSLGLQWGEMGDINLGDFLDFLFVMVFLQVLWGLNCSEMAK